MQKNMWYTHGKMKSSQVAILKNQTYGRKTLSKRMYPLTRL